MIPFLKAGYTRGFGNSGFINSDNLFNFGGGFDYWVFKRVGLRLDFRDFVDHASLRTGNYPAIRIGLTLR